MVDKLPGEYGFEDTSFRAMGGAHGVRRLVDHFFDLMATLPEARKIHDMHGEDTTVVREKLSVFLTGWLGGPREYSKRWGQIRIPSAHAHLDIGVEERDAWLSCMRGATEKMPIGDEFRSYFLREIAVPAGRCVTRGPDPENEPEKLP